MRKIVAGLVIAGLFLGIGLPVAASAREPSLDGVVYWSEEEVDSLFSPGLMRTLDLSSSQRRSFQDLRNRDWGYRPDHRYSRDLDALFSLGRIIRPGGSRIVIERGSNDNLDTFLAILAFGIILSQTQDNDRYYDYDYDYYCGYGQGRWIRIDDFLYLFSRILNFHQRNTFRIYFDRWYYDYYYRRDNRRDNERYYRELMRDWERRLRLSEKQRRDMERYFKDLHFRHWESDRQYRDIEKDYLRKNWDRDSFRDIDRYRHDLLKYRRESLEPPGDARDRFRTILNDQQRRTFDSMIRERETGQWDRERPAPPKFQNKLEPPKIQNKPGSDQGQKKPGHPPGQKKPGPPIIKKPIKDGK